MSFTITWANQKHREAINRLITKTKIGRPYKKGERMETFWIAKTGTRIVACHGLDMWHNNEVGVLTACAVEKEFRKQGIGSALMERALAEAKRRGAKTAALCTMYYWFRFLKKREFQTCPRKNLPEAVQTYPMFTDPRYKKCAVMVRSL